MKKKLIKTEYIISILIENEAGALSRVAGLFSARGYNIESLTVAATEDASLSRMTIVTTGTDRVIEQITKQLNKLIDVVKLLELTDGPHIEREMLLLKVAVTTEETQQQLRRLLEVFKGHLIDHTSMTMTIQLTQTGEQIDSFIAALTDYEILETVRSGVSGIARGDKYLKI